MIEDLPLGMPVEACVRLDTAIRETRFSKAELERRTQIASGTLSRLTSPAALSDNVRRPQMGAQKFIQLAILLNRDPIWLMGYTDVQSPLVAKYKREFNDLVDRMSTEMMESAAARCAVEGEPIGIQDVLRWWQDTGGEVGRGSEIEECFDVVHMPDANDRYVRPIRVGSKSYASRRLGSNDPERLLGEVLSWPEGERVEIVKRFRQITMIENGASFPTTRMKITVRDRPEPEEYWCIRMSAKIAGPNAPEAAITFAFTV